MSVPLLDLRRENGPLLEEIMAAMKPVMESSSFILGKTVSDFEAQSEAYLELQPPSYALGVSSGTDALLLALHALELPAGGEVITTPFTFYATAGTIHRAGLKPRFVDILPDTFNIDSAKIEAAINGNTVAIMPVHLYGQMADMDAIMAIAKKHNLPVIEDTAQSIGARQNGKQAGTIGDYGAYSFFPTKNLGAFGDAGLLASTRADLRDKTFRNRVHGQKDRYEHIEIGGNFRIDALQAAVLSVKMKHLNSWHEMRRANAKTYNEFFAASPIDEVVLPVEKPGNYHIYNQFIIRVTGGKRDALKKHLDDAGIGNMIYYPRTLHEQVAFSYLGHKKGDFPISEQATEEVLALPIHSYITKEEILETSKAIAAFFGK